MKKHINKILAITGVFILMATPVRAEITPQLFNERR